MGSQSIPVRFDNPGAVFACLGFLEASDLLCGPTRGGFVDAYNSESFVLETEAANDPVGHVLEFLEGANAYAVVPQKWPIQNDADQRRSSTFPTGTVENMALPVLLSNNGIMAQLDHWADGSDRDPFKLYAGNRSALTIMRDLLTRFRRLWQTRHDKVSVDPLNALCQMGGSFNFDPRGAWTALDAGYSPNHQSQAVFASPVVEILAAWGLQNARPSLIEQRRYRYGVWREMLSPMLARAVLGGSVVTVPQQRFLFNLDLSGKNKIVTFAQEEMI